MASSSASRLLWAATLVSGATIGSRLLGFLRDSIIASYYGQTATVDQYNAAYVIPDTIYLLLIGGAISAAFVPVLADYLARGDHENADRIVNSALNLVVVGMLPLLLMGELIAPFLVRIIAVGFNGDPGAIAHTAFLTRIMLMAVLFHAINGVLVGNQYARKSFWATAIGPLFYNISIIVVGAEWGRIWGIQAFAWGVLIGAFVNFLIQLWGVYRLQFRYQWVMDLHHPGFRRIWRLMLPVIFGVGLGQINLVINQTFLASLLPAGGINALRLASRIMLTPVSLASSLAIALLPNLTEVVALKDFARFRQYLSAGLRSVIFITLPASVGLLLVDRPLVAVLFEHGRFSAQNVSVTASAVTFYALGIVAYGCIDILVGGFYALKNTKTPVVVGAIVLVAGLFLNWILLHTMQDSGLALAYSLTGYLNLLLLGWTLRRQILHMDGTRVARTLVRTAIAAGIMALGVAVASTFLASWISGPTFVLRLLGLSLEIGVGTVLFILAAQRFHIEEYRMLVNHFRLRRRSVSST